MIDSLADLYKNTVGSLPLKVKIIGRPEFLHVAEHASQCRALLLAGMRASVLWQQVGGSRWQLLFARKKILAQVQRFSP